jgi:tripartite-type tricarboxylate transporter receptor subunit TctC
MKGNWTCYMLAWLLVVAAVAEANAQPGQYPTKPVQIITDSSAGSTPDVALRIVADGLTQSWKATGPGEQPSGCRRQPRGPSGSDSRP